MTRSQLNGDMFSLKRDLNKTGSLPILRTECVQSVSEKIFSFYIDYPSQK